MTNLDKQQEKLRYPRDKKRTRMEVNCSYNSRVTKRIIRERNDRQKRE